MHAYLAFFYNYYLIKKIILWVAEILKQKKEKLLQVLLGNQGRQNQKPQLRKLLQKKQNSLE